MEVPVDHGENLLLFALSLSKGFDRLSLNGVVSRMIKNLQT